MAEAEARQASEGVKIELFLTERDVELARQGRHQIEVTLAPGFEEANDRTPNRHPVEVIVMIGEPGVYE
jgi:hypothetical protein